MLKALRRHPAPGSVTLIAIGKAAWRMASAAYGELGSAVRQGLVITKYGHSMGTIGPLEIIEAGHPVPDENSVAAGRRALALADALGEGDQVLLLISGGGSALFEAPAEGVSLADVADTTRQLLACGADITEINTLRKRLSAVKGGRLAQRCAPAKVLGIVLSDVLGDALDTIASGPAYPDASTCADAEAIMAKYGLTLPPNARRALENETPKTLDNVTTEITGSVRELCAAAADACRELGYRPYVLTRRWPARPARRAACWGHDAGRAGRRGVLRKTRGDYTGGETVVHLRGKGLGGRNQELAAAAGLSIDGLPDVCVFSLGSDGTDGPRMRPAAS